jgi:hypothetical protein
MGGLLGLAVGVVVSGCIDRDTTIVGWSVLTEAIVGGIVSTTVIAAAVEGGRASTAGQKAAWAGL